MPMAMRGGKYAESPTKTRSFSNAQNNNRMRFRFTIRDLLLLTVVVALAVGWWLDHKRLDLAMNSRQIKTVDPKEKLSQKEELYLNGEPRVRTFRSSEIGKPVPI